MFDISCKLSPMKTICVKCQILFSGEKNNKKNITSVLSAEFGQTVVKLRGLNTLGVFSAMFHKRDNFCDFLLAFLHIKLLLNRICSKREEFAPIGSKFFPFKVDCFTVRQITIVKIDDCSEPLVTCFIPLLALADNNTSYCKQMCIEISLFIYRIAERIPSLSVCLFVFLNKHPMLYV